MFLFFSIPEKSIQSQLALIQITRRNHPFKNRTGSLRSCRHLIDEIDRIMCGSELYLIIIEMGYNKYSTITCGFSLTSNYYHCLFFISIAKCTKHFNSNVKHSSDRDTIQFIGDCYFIYYLINKQNQMYQEQRKKFLFLF